MSLTLPLASCLTSIPAFLQPKHLLRWFVATKHSLLELQIGSEGKLKGFSRPSALLIDANLFLMVSAIICGALLEPGE